MKPKICSYKIASGFVAIIIAWYVFIGQSAESNYQRIVLCWENDPATTQSVVWRTKEALTNPQAQIALLTKHLDEASKAAQTVAAISETIKMANQQIVYYHTAHFSSLTPGKFYLYRVGGDSTWSEWNVFRTAERDAKPFQFIYFGDVQDNILSDWSVLVRQAFAKAPHARFYLYAGDLVGRGKDDQDWEEFFSALGFIPRMIPMVPVPGNHDANKDILRLDGSRQVDPLFLAHFSLPHNGPQVSDLIETAYYLDYQGARIIAFNSNSYRDPEQLAWLKKTLSESKANWNIVCHHHPLFSVGRKRDDEKLRQQLMPIYQSYQVDLVLQGHDHRYGRTNKIRDGKQVGNDEKAPVYVVSVSGPKAYEHNPNFAHLLQVESGETQCFQILTISPTEINYEAWSLDNQLIDSFTLRQEHKGTVLVNQLP